MQWKMVMAYFRSSIGSLLNLLLLASMVSGCATTARSPNDPLEPMNREFFQFNSDLDEAILQPAAKAYRYVMPNVARKGIRNFSSNLSDAYSFASNVLQLKPTNAGQDLLRVAFNTFFGLGGLLDIASSIGIEKQNQDLGLALARWGVGSGPFLMLPFLGPTTVRDSMHNVAVLYHPLSRYVFTDWRVQTAYQSLSLLEFRVQLMDTEAALEGAMIDRYQQIRDFYLQHRAFMISGGQIDYGDTDFLDDDFDLSEDVVDADDSSSAMEEPEEIENDAKEMKNSQEPAAHLEFTENGYHEESEDIAEEEKQADSLSDKPEPGVPTDETLFRKENV